MFIYNNSLNKNNYTQIGNFKLGQRQKHNHGILIIKIAFQYFKDLKNLNNKKTIKNQF